MKRSVQKQLDRTAIEKIKGAYKVDYNFAETFAPDPAYPFRKRYRENSALEWITPVAETHNAISLQHILMVKDGLIVKHWREDWIYENRDFYLFDSGAHWKYVSMPEERVRGTWTQKVYNVDDSPHYQGWGEWIHRNGKSYWVGEADAPLPRREYTQRCDYHVMHRRNRCEINSNGWIHEQDNQKIIRTADSDELLVFEKGMNRYTRVPDTECRAVQKWWAENQALWDKVRAEWETILSRRKDITRQSKVKGKSLHEYLFDLKPNASKRAVQDIIQKFVV